MFWIPIDRTMDMPLIRQVYEQIRMRILHGELVAGECLPPTRELASSLGISRNVVVEAYEQLIAEGYIEAQQGSGTYVAEGAYLDKQEKLNCFTFFDKQQIKEETNDVIDFRSGLPALDMFPRKMWGQIAKQVCIDTSHSIFGYGYPEGRIELRHILARYLKRTRGVYCHSDQLVITSGATQGLSLIASLLLSPGDEVIIEDPITHEIQTIFTSPGSTLHPIPVDEQGMKTDLLPANKRPSFIFVTPSHQFPLGGVLPIQRRIQLIQFARTTDCYIVEDDYDSEFRYHGAPISSLQGLDPDRVIYIGTFSKILSPALRLGYLILPPSLTKRCKDLKWFTDLHTPSLQQLTAARFIKDRHLERHIRKMKKIYQGRRDHVKKCLAEQFGHHVNILGDSTGLHLIAEFQNITFSDQKVEEIIKKYKVKIYPVEQHTIQKGTHQNKVIIGYGNLTIEEIEEGIRRLKEALTSEGK
ncbi:PLP-dependent aminotransferase family protein [Bacillus aquiflavi]|uniref:PLP-dependent aminotransferase family protein n=1 Tax=Bacillus aquiflavi TaxID=2672567 RepID=A0A6B3VYX2_9BACI|nr:PLP-dependent aminotransferase family protein [Bacillus aquiflavi]MBA4538128.1 PLP-dependent aminotransferase family protein [Bacillus aquiflavi]NEY82448.1 PLP-dependent aminotransferase family protein [Bacillus aquiflavi]UAC48580.1 PLP-dependent aminotransferase family protein [Bacillus aquiflavi]